MGPDNSLPTPTPGPSARNIDGIVTPGAPPAAGPSAPQVFIPPPAQVVPPPDANQLVTAGTALSQPPPQQGAIPESMLTKSPTPHKRTVPVVAISAAIIITTLLIVLATYIFIRSNQHPTTSKTPSPSASQTSDGRVKASDIEAASNTIDQNLNNINDTKDFSPNDLSNNTLGL